jgi:NTE family protein
MSSGFFAFFAHTGLLTVLEDEGLLPVRVSGSSAGALVTAAWASGIDGPILAAELRQLTRADFWDPTPGFGLLRGRLFRKKLEALLPVRSLTECRVTAAVSVHDAFSHTTRVLERGDIATAIHASCAVPLLFHPVRIDGRIYVDGGVSDRPGLAGMPAKIRVLYHHIESRSVFRGLDSRALPRREGMTALLIEDLPQPGPFRLDEGRRAFEIARRAARTALERPIHGDVIRIEK